MLGSCEVTRPEACRSCQKGSEIVQGVGVHLAVSLLVAFPVGVLVDSGRVRAPAPAPYPLSPVPCDAIPSGFIQCLSCPDRLALPFLLRS